MKVQQGHHYNTLIPEGTARRSKKTVYQISLLCVVFQSRRKLAVAHEKSQMMNPPSLTSEGIYGTMAECFSKHLHSAEYHLLVVQN